MEKNENIKFNIRFRKKADFIRRLKPVKVGAGMAQWWEHSRPTNVSRVRFPHPPPYVGWVCCRFSSLLRDVFLRVLQFFPLLENQISKFQFDLDYCQTLYYEPLARVIAYIVIKSVESSMF